METYIALFRGINVGGRNSIKMADLRSLLENLGLEDVRSYIQSGNVVFRSGNVDLTEMADRISKSIEENHGFEPRVLILRQNEFEKAIAGNPFPKAESDDRRLHINFLSEKPGNPDLNTMQEIKKDNELFALKDKTFYLYAPDGIGRSKLAANVEKHLGVPATSRNWRTVQKIASMVDER